MNNTIVQDYIKRYTEGWDDEMHEKYDWEVNHDAERYFEGYKAALTIIEKYCTQKNVQYMPQGISFVLNKIKILKNEN